MKALSTKRKEQIKARYNALYDELVQWNFMADKVDTSIHHAYKNPSQYKIYAWQEIRKCQKEYKGTTPIILSHNYQSFTACFAYPSENGKVRYRYFTKDYTYDFE